MSYLHGMRYLEAREIYEATTRRLWHGPRWVLWLWMWSRRYQWDGTVWVKRYASPVKRYSK